jgi:GST-like protein
MNKRLAEHPYLAGAEYTIADMAVVGWTTRWERQGQDPGQFPHVKRWLETLQARPAVQKGIALAVDDAKKVDMKDPKVWNLLFNQRAR